MSGVAVVALRLRGVVPTVVVGAGAAGVLLLAGDATVALPFLHDRHVGSPPAALLAATTPGVALGTARRSLLPHLHLTAARSLARWRVIGHLLCSAVLVPVLRCAPPELAVACGRNVLFALGLAAVAAVVLDQGSAWLPLLVVLLVMSLFGARPGDAYAAWAVVFQPGDHVGALLVALAAWSAGLACEALGLQQHLDRIHAVAPAGGA